MEKNLTNTLEYKFLTSSKNLCTKKDLHDQDNHDGVITHLEPDTLDCGVQWALGSVTQS